nr:hypothetical protein [uncultured Ruminococcus sp.]
MQHKGVCKRYCRRCCGNSRNQSDELKKRTVCCNAASNYVDENGETKFSEIAHPISKEVRDLLNSKVMEAYHQALDEQQSEDESENMSEDESESFTQSM